MKVNLHTEGITMAYMNQNKKATIAAAVKPILAKYRMKGTLSVRNHSTIVLTLTSGPIDFIGDLAQERQFGYHAAGRVILTHLFKGGNDKMRERYELDVNPYWYQEHYSGESLAFLSEIFPALKGADWYDRSDAQVDYFDTAYYVDVNVGKWNKPYVVTQ
jgi:hypothetical protein